MLLEEKICFTPRSLGFSFLVGFFLHFRLQLKKLKKGSQTTDTVNWCLSLWSEHKAVTTKAQSCWNDLMSANKSARKITELIKNNVLLRGLGEIYLLLLLQIQHSRNLVQSMKASISWTAVMVMQSVIMMRAFIFPLGKAYLHFCGGGIHVESLRATHTPYTTA